VVVRFIFDFGVGMERLAEFIGNHWLLSAATAAVVIALLVLEIRRLRSGITSLEPGAATQLYNRENAVFLDIRSEAEFRKQHLPGAISTPADTLAARLQKLERFRDRPIVVYCDTGLRSSKAAAQVKQAGFERTYELRGGINAWLNAGYPVESK